MATGSPSESRDGERRRRSRYRVRPTANEPLFVEIATEAGSIRAHVLDLSLSGAEVFAIDDARPSPSVGSPAKVWLHLPGLPAALRVEARIARVDVQLWHSRYALEFRPQEFTEPLAVQRHLRAYLLRRQCEQLEALRRVGSADRRRA